MANSQIPTEKDDKTILDDFLSQASIILNQQQLGNTPLHLAAYQGRTDIIELLLHQKAKADSANIYGETPLHIAVRQGHGSVVALLLQHGANIYKRNNLGSIPLYLATEAEPGQRKASYPEIIKLLVAADNKMVPRYKKIWDSALGNDAEALTNLLVSARKPSTPFWQANPSEFKNTIKFLKSNPYATQQHLLQLLEEKKEALLDSNFNYNSEPIIILNFAIATLEYKLAQKETKVSMNINRL